MYGGHITDQWDRRVPDLFGVTGVFEATKASSQSSSVQKSRAPKVLQPEIIIQRSVKCAENQKDVLVL